MIRSVPLGKLERCITEGGGCSSTSVFKYVFEENVNGVYKNKKTYSIPSKRKILRRLTFKVYSSNILILGVLIYLFVCSTEV